MENINPHIENILNRKDSIFLTMGEAVELVFWIRDVQGGELLYLSPTATAMTGFSVDIISRDRQAWLNLVHPDDAANIATLQMKRISETIDVEYRIVRADGTVRWVHDQSEAIRNQLGEVMCIAGIVRDITEKKGHIDEIQFLNSIYAALSQTNHALITCKDEATLYQRVCDIAVSHGGMALAWIGLEVPGTQLIKPVAIAGEQVGYLDGIIISTLESEVEGRGPTGTAFREKHPIFVQDFSASTMTLPWRLRAEQFGLRASAALGFRRGGKPYAVLTLYHRRANAFNEKTVELFIEMAANLSYGIDLLDIEIARKENEIRLQESSRRNQNIIETSVDGFWILNREGRILDVNGAYLRRSGYSRDELLDMHAKQVEAVDDAVTLEHRITRLMDIGSMQFETLHRAKDGLLWPLEVKAVYLPEEEGCVFAFLRDLTERKRAEEEIINLGFYDALTNLPNRRLLLDRLHHAMNTSARNHLYGAVLFIDLDHFKVINDTLGHKVGDLLLKQVAQRMCGLVREDDTVARQGGDEFVAILEGLDSNIARAMASVSLVGEKLLEAFNKPYLLEKEELVCTASVGVVLFRGNEVSIEELLKHSDMAMYGAKKTGRNTFRFFDPAMQYDLEKRSRLESDLRRCLAEGQLRAFCQKRVDHRGRLKGGEMLLRWQHPERGLVSPLEFIPLAEEIGLIVPMGQWILRVACEQLNRWQAHANTRAIALSVNVSAREFRQNDFVDNLRKILTETGADPRLLELEITESMLLEGVDELIEKMRVMNDIGLSFSLDDFGTGYSSLSYLKKLPLRQLKIDRSFVKDLGRDRSDEAIVQTIVRMGETLRLDVVAEGVETEEQRQLLELYGCHHYQGFLFGKPVPLDVFLTDAGT